MSWNIELTNNRIAVVKIWNAMVRGARKYCEREGFMFVHNLPLLVGVTGACENTDSLFTVDWYDGEKKFLAQSDQLYIESLSQIFGKVCCEIQSFRKEEKSDGRRLAQFSLFEMELVGDLDDLLLQMEGLVRSAANEVYENCKEELKLFGRDPEAIKDLEFDRMKYEDAVELLKFNGFPELQFGDDLKANHENRLTELLGPVFITHYPEEIKFFNMIRNDCDPRVVNSADLLLPLAGESAGSSAREYRYDELVKKLENSSMFANLVRQGMKREDFEWYLNQHKDADVKLHSGCGIGLNRVAQFIMGQSDIRKCAPFLIDRENII